MSIQIIGGGSDLSGAINTSNNNFRDIQSDMQKRIIYDEQGTRVVMLDKNGLKTTASNGGIDVFTAADDQLTFNSNFKALKYVEKNTVALNTGTVGAATSSTFTASGTFTGTYSTAPLVLAFYYSGSNYYGQWFGGSGLGVAVPFTISVSASGIVTHSAIFQKTLVTPTGVTFTAVCYNDSGSLTFPNFTIKYYVLQESAV